MNHLLEAISLLLKQIFELLTVGHVAFLGAEQVQVLAVRDTVPRGRERRPVEETLQAVCLATTFPASK